MESKQESNAKVRFEEAANFRRRTQSYLSPKMKFMGNYGNRGSDEFRASFVSGASIISQSFIALVTVVFTAAST